MIADLPLAWRLARREMRAGTQGFRVFIACLAIGVAAIAGVGTLSNAIYAGIAGDARALLGGDAELRLQNREATGGELAFIRDTTAAVSQAVELRAMARPADARDRRALTELKTVDDAYPLVGSLQLEPAENLADLLAWRDGMWGAVAAPALIRKLDLAIGDPVRVGEATFALRAALTHEPDEVVSLFDLGPRLMIAHEALAETGLIQPGSQYQYHYRVLMEPGTAVDGWTAAVARVHPEAGWRVRSFENAAPGVRRFIGNMTVFLTFAGLTALLVGGIGVANAVSAYLEGKTATIATMKCVGAPRRLVFQVYILQVALLALLGIAIGLVVGAIAPLLGLGALAPYLPVAPRIGLYPGPLILGAVFGLLTALTFGLWPLARATEVPAARLYRDQVTNLPARRRLSALMAVGICAVALAALTVASADRPGFAAWFVVGAAFALALLRGASAVVVRLARRITVPRRAELRLAVANLHRPGSSTASVVVSLGLGISVLVAVALIQGNLSRQVSERLPENAPAFFFIDIQPGQLDAFTAAVTGVEGAANLRQAATLRGRIVAIDGVPVEQAQIAEGVRWAVRGDRTLTYAADLPEDTRIVAGAWWPADYSGPPLLSFDADVAAGMGVGVGDTLTVNVLGRDITATIASLRDIEWRSIRFDFTMIFAPGALEAAPHTHVAAVEATPEAEDAVERAGTEGFPNISAIRVREALAAAADLLSATSAAVRSTAGISILSGILVLGGAVAAGRRRRIYDSVVFKVLGADRRILWTAFLAEYGVLGLVTGVIAAVVGTLTAWAVIVFVMGGEWIFLPSVAVLTVILCIAVTIVVGFAGTWRALGQKAAPYLRNE